MQEDNIALKMVRPDLDHLPSYETPGPSAFGATSPGTSRRGNRSTSRPMPT